MKTQFYLTSVLAVVGLAVWAYQDGEDPLAPPKGVSAPARAMDELRETLAAQVRLLSRQAAVPPSVEIAANHRAQSLGLELTGRTDAPIHRNDRTAPGLPGPKGWWKETP